MSRAPGRVRGGFALAAGLVLAGLALSGVARAESFAVVAVGDPPNGLDPDLAELTHQLRAACRDRVANVLDVPTMHARMLGQSDGATLSELDRAYGGALAVYQNGEFDSALRTLRAIVADLEALPEGADTYTQWIRALLRLAHAASTIGLDIEADAAMAKLLRVEPHFRADPDQYSPTYRRRMDEVRARVRALPQRRVTVLSAGRAGSIFVDGRPSGTTPMTVFLPAGRYRIGGAAGPLRVPSFQVDVTAEDRTVVLDFPTAEALRMTLGPGLALPMARRGEGLIRAGAWLDVDKLVVASRGFEGDAPFLVGSIYDVRRGAMLREGSVRTVAGTVPLANIGALAAFLLTGAQQREVRGRSSEVLVASSAETIPLADPPARAVMVPAAPLGQLAPWVPARTSAAPRPDLRPAPPADPSGSETALALEPSRGGEPGGQRAWLAPRPWMRPAAWVSGGIAVGFAGLAVSQRIAASDAYDRAEALLAPGGGLSSSTDLSRYHDLVARGDTAVRNTWISAGASVVFAAAAGVLGWTSGQPSATPGY